MRKNILITIILSLFFTGTSFALTVGGPADMTVPEASFSSKARAVRDTLDSYEAAVNVKAGFDVEFISKKELEAAPADDTNIKIEGQNVNVKFSMNYSDVLEPYVKIGTSNLRVKWEQHDQNIVVEAQPGLVLGGGLKAKLWEFAGTGIKLTVDGQYKDTQLDFDKAKIGGSTSTASATSETFNIKEWQVSLLASKKFIFPMGIQDCYTVPYMGITYSDSDVKVEFTQSTTGLLYSTYNASNKNPIGLVLGCDIIPSLLDWYLISVELRLINETAFTISGTMKF
ncbi:MAG: hypothetical protein CO035_00990 [Candidatus Omnitrophica bacterium CG_4_9_14_0_2_um_filter_42_8]|nr:MAG: hypothetical protein COW92_04525 [Candidatus Omnitrophica bacterium CG22_combo_CG10-13_8_21_14_all_43_16]PJC48910.1 MAG: hypothetical protein CO035_00990 [Candidatus Omnitrophica bacterium CG_4_9_14_0_2_um_filter_42_8]